MSALDPMLEVLESLSSLAADSMPSVTAALRGELETTIGAGTTPEGVAWALRKEDNARALPDAVTALTVTHAGLTIYAQLRGPEARHHRGWGRGGTRRQMLPTRGLTRAQADAMRAAVTREFDRRVQT